jgi:hypothetical protein
MQGILPTIILVLVAIGLVTAISSVWEDFGRPKACSTLRSFEIDAVRACRIKPPPPCNGVPYLPPEDPAWNCWRTR